MNNNSLTKLRKVRQIRETAANALLHEIGDSLFYISHYESGRIAETLMQVMSERVFEAVCMLVLGHEREELVRDFSVSIAFQIAHKLGLVLRSEETILEAAGSIVALICCENMRRRGLMEYLWINNIFADKPSDVGFTRLTDSGKERALIHILESFVPNSIQ